MELVELVVRGDHGIEAGLVEKLAEGLSRFEVREVADDLPVVVLPIADLPSTLMLARQLVIFSEKKRLMDYLHTLKTDAFTDCQALAELSVLLNSAGDVQGALRLVDLATQRGGRRSVGS